MLGKKLPVNVVHKTFLLCSCHDVHDVKFLPIFGLIWQIWQLWKRLWAKSYTCMTNRFLIFDYIFAHFLSIYNFKPDPFRIFLEMNNFFSYFFHSVYYVLYTVQYTYLGTWCIENCSATPRNKKKLRARRISDCCLLCYI